MFTLSFSFILPDFYCFSVLGFTYYQISFLNGKFLPVQEHEIHYIISIVYVTHVQEKWSRALENVFSLTFPKYQAKMYMNFFKRKIYIQVFLNFLVWLCGKIIYPEFKIP